MGGRDILSLPTCQARATPASAPALPLGGGTLRRRPRDASALRRPHRVERATSSRMDLDSRGFTTRLSPVERWRQVTPLQRRLRAVLGTDFATAYLFMLPTFVIMGGLIAYPFARATYISFTRTISQEIGPFVGLANYRALWADRFFRESVAVTAQYTVWSVAISLTAALVAALLIHRMGTRGGLVAALVLLPWVMPEIVRALTWRALLDPLYGGVNRVLIGVGLIERGFPFFGSLTTALPSVILVNVWQRIPFATITLLAGLKGIDVELYEAASIDGAGAWRRFLHVTLPGLRHAAVVAFLLCAIWSFNEFSLIFLLTGGGPMNVTKVYSVLAYQLARRQMGKGVAVALSGAPVFVALIAILGRAIVEGEGTQVPADAAAGPLSRLTRPARRLVARGMRLLWATHDVIETAVARAWGTIARPLGAGTRGGRIVYRAVPVLLTLAVLAFELAPFYWVLVTAFKAELQITLFESVLWPRPWTTIQFERLLGPRRSFMLWLQNTLIVSTGSALLSTGAAAMGAYGITRLRWRGAALLGQAALVSYLMPAVMIVMPIFHLFARLGLVNTRLSLILSYPAFALPFALWLLMGYYRSIPAELEDAAMIDGCNRLQAFLRVILPLSMPGLVAVLLFAMSQAWGEFLFAYTLIFTETMMTLPLGLGQMIFGDVLPWGELSAATLIMAVPVLAVYALGQRHMVAGLTAGAVRGRG